jgi:hypothetical protein
MSSAFIQAAVILLREGLEALLVIAALAGYLTKAGAAHRVQALYGGALAAIAASLVAAWLFAILNSGEHSDIMEGIIILVAAGLMLYVSGWLMVKQDPRRQGHRAPGKILKPRYWPTASSSRKRRRRKAGDTNSRDWGHHNRGPGNRRNGSIRNSREVSRSPAAGASSPAANVRRETCHPWA